MTARVEPGPTEPLEAWSLAQALLERYDVDADPADLDRAIDLLLDLTYHPVHPDPVAGQWLLSCAYEERAHATGRIEDYDDAIMWGERLGEWLDPADPETDELTVHQADLRWDRSWALRYRPDSGPDGISELIDSLDTVRLSGGNPIAEHYLRFMRGSARIERYVNAD